jgi:hypothetical protein
METCNVVTDVITLLGLLAVAAVVGVAWLLSVARAETRWRAALDRYAERELAKRAYPRRGLAVRDRGRAG